MSTSLMGSVSSVDNNGSMGMGMGTMCIIIIIILALTLLLRSNVIFSTRHNTNTEMIHQVGQGNSIDGYNDVSGVDMAISNGGRYFDPTVTTNTRPVVDSIVSPRWKIQHVQEDVYLLSLSNDRYLYASSTASSTTNTKSTTFTAFTPFPTINTRKMTLSPRENIDESLYGFMWRITPIDPSRHTYTIHNYLNNTCLFRDSRGDLTLQLDNQSGALTCGCADVTKSHNYLFTIKKHNMD